MLFRDEMDFPILETERLRLIQLSEEHLPDMFELYSDEEAMTYWDCFPHADIKDTI
jgi:ribosomal-protein-alanine N-acetyltransferase